MLDALYNFFTFAFLKSRKQKIFRDHLRFFFRTLISSRNLRKNVRSGRCEKRKAGGIPCEVESAKPINFLFLQQKIVMIRTPMDSQNQFATATNQSSTTSGSVSSMTKNAD